MAVAIPKARGVAVAASAYDVRFVTGQAASDEQLRGKLQMVKDAYEAVRSEQQTDQVDVLLCADFDRHHVFLGGPQAFE